VAAGRDGAATCAHGQNDVRAAYNYAEYLPQRREKMQAWADYLDGLRGGGDMRSPDRSPANETILSATPEESAIRRTQ
jgi:hypothetical protein